MELWRYPDEDGSGWQYPMIKSHNMVAQADALTSQFEHFCRMIRQEEEPIADAREGTRSLSVALGVLESIQRQLPIALPAA